MHHERCHIKEKKLSLKDLHVFSKLSLFHVNESKEGFEVINTTRHSFFPLRDFPVHIDIQLLLLLNNVSRFLPSTEMFIESVYPTVYWITRLVLSLEERMYACNYALV